MQRVLAVSERRACRVLEQPRSTHRYQGTLIDRDKGLVDAMKEKADQKKRWGYRQITAHLNKAG